VIEAFCRKVWNLACDKEKVLFRRILLLCMGSMLLFSLIVFFLFLEEFELLLHEHWVALIAFAGIALASGALFAFLFHRLVSRGMLRALAKFECVQSGSLQQMTALVSRMEYRALGDKLMRALTEDRREELASEKVSLLAQARYPWYVSPVLLERMLADENAVQMRGRTKESVLVFLSLPGLSAACINAEQKQASNLIRKVLARTLALARSSGMLLVQFSLESSVLIADVPYAASASLRKRLPALSRKWYTQLLDVLKEEGATSLRPAFFLHYGELFYGRIQDGGRNAFIVDPQSWQISHAAARAHAAQGGVLVSQQYSTYANFDCKNPSLAESVSGTWYLLK
jgi:hypothetical protein